MKKEAVRDGLSAGELLLDGQTGAIRPRRRRGGLDVDTREKLIWCGTKLLTERGFHAVGIEEVLSCASVPKGSFYHYFESKQAFGEAVIDNFARYFNRKLDRILKDETGTPLTRLRAFVKEATDGMTRYEFRRGCLIGNLGQELGGLNEEFRNRIEAVLQSWQARVATCLTEAQQANEISLDQDVHALAEFFWIGWEGAILRSKLARSVAPMERFASLFFSRVCT